MDTLSKICYKKSFLNQVIVRIDFMEYVPTEKIYSDSIESSIQDFFPRKGKTQVIKFNAINFVLDINNPKNSNAKNDTVEGEQREYFSANLKNKLIVSNMFLIFEIHQYTSFDEHSKWLKGIIQSIFSECKPVAIRTGMRYINLFNSDEIKLRKSYFSSEISAGLKNKIDPKDHLTRSMHLAEYRFNNLVLNFRYGMFNPNYPSLLRTNSFSLDYDCFSNDAFSSSDDVLEVLRQGHDEIQRLFETSITDALRKVMNGE